MENSAPQEKFSINEESLKKLKEILDKQTKLISAGVFTEEEVQHFARVVSQEKFKAGEALFDAGDKAEKVYLLYEGEVVVQRTVQDDKTFKISLYPGHLFGELAVIFNLTRHAAVLAKEDSVCLTLIKQEFMDLIPKKKRDRFLSFFNTIELFQDANENAKEVAIQFAAIKIYEDGEFIIKQVGLEETRLSFFSTFDALFLRFFLFLFLLLREELC